MPKRGRPIYLGKNDDEPEKAVQRKNPATGQLEASTGMTGLTFRLAASPTGSAIDPSLSKNATERGLTGIYYAVLEGTDIETYLNTASYVGKTVYEIFSDNQNVNYVTARRVIALRP